MSDITTKPAGISLPFNGHDYPLVFQTQPGRKTKTNPTPKDTHLLLPELTSTAVAAQFFVDLLTDAETSKAGEGLALAHSLLAKQLRAATDEAIDEKTGSLNEGDWAARLIVTKGKRGGLTEDELNNRLTDAIETWSRIEELLKLQSTDPSGEGYVESDDIRNGRWLAAGYKSEDELAHAAFRVKNEMKDLAAISSERKAKREAAAQKRAEKEKLAAATAGKEATPAH